MAGSGEIDESSQRVTVLYSEGVWTATSEVYCPKDNGVKSKKLRTRALIRNPPENTALRAWSGRVRGTICTAFPSTEKNVINVYRDKVSFRGREK